MIYRPYPFSLHDRLVEWRDLEAWERPLDCVLWVRRSDDVDSSGWAVCGTGEIGLTVGLDAADGYATLLHEMAHIAAGVRGKVAHSPRWRAAFLDAAAEVLGKRPAPAKMTNRHVHYAVRLAFAERFDLAI